MKTLISLYDYTGNWSRPYREAGWNVVQVDIQHGKDIMDFDPRPLLDGDGYSIPEFGILAAQPCDNYALCGSKHFAAKDADGRTAASQQLVARTKQIVDFIDKAGVLNFWVVENPRSRIHTLNPWLGKIKHRFNPCDYAGYDPCPDKSRYNKDTWLWGRFNKPEKKYIAPIGKEYPGFTNLGGKSLATKNARSITPLGFAYAFYESNQLTGIKNEGQQLS